MMARIAFSFLALFSLSSCCTLPPEPDFSTPAATLCTFQKAFRADAPEIEYACFSLDFKETMGSLDLDRYEIMRDRVLEDNPLLSTLFKVKDIDSFINKTEFRNEPSGIKKALMTISLLGREITLLFICETIYRMEFNGGVRPMEVSMPPLYPISMRKRKEAVMLVIPDVHPRCINNISLVRKLVVEEQWKLADFFSADLEEQRP